MHGENMNIRKRLKQRNRCKPRESDIPVYQRRFIDRINNGCTKIVLTKRVGSITITSHFFPKQIATNKAIVPIEMLCP